MDFARRYTQIRDLNRALLSDLWQHVFAVTGTVQLNTKIRPRFTWWPVVKSSKPFSHQELFSNSRFMWGVRALSMCVKVALWKVCSLLALKGLRFSTLACLQLGIHELEFYRGRDGVRGATFIHLLTTAAPSSTHAHVHTRQLLRISTI